MDTKALQKLSYGIYVVSSALDGKLNGQIANTVFQVTSEPAKIAICVNKQNLTHEFIEKSRRFSVSVLSTEAPLTFIGKFGFKSGKDTDKFKDTKFETWNFGIPVVLDHTVSCLEAEIESSCDVGTHTLFVGKITGTKSVSDNEPMTYDWYHKNLKGKAPKTAPTYNSEKT